jgi:choline dehydrogenase-like flavoprotein
VSAPPLVDVIVVGSGAAGGWAAKELTERGLSVLLLEAGPMIAPEQVFPLPAPGERRIASRLAGGLGGQLVQMRCLSYNARTRRLFVDDRENPYTTPPGMPFNWFRGRQVGGRLHTWARIALRLSNRELKAASLDGHGVDWPLDYDELAPYYDRVEAFLGVHGSRDGVDVLPDGVYIEPRPMTEEEERFRAIVESGFPGRRVLAARTVAHDPLRVPSPLRAAQSTGRLVLRSDAVVRAVLVEPGTGNATGVAFVDRVANTLHETRSRAVVLCAGAIDTVRILLNSACTRHPEGLGNSTGNLGRGLMDHVLVGLGGKLGSRSAVHDDPEGVGDPYDFGRSTGFTIPRFRNVGDRRPDFLRGYAVQGAIGRGGPHWHFLAHGEMLALSENRVTLDPRVRDAWGIPAAHIACAPSENERAMARDALETMREMAEAAGLRISQGSPRRTIDTVALRLWRRRLLLRSGAFVPGSAVHETGGAALGTDPATSVLNRFNQCWDAPNVLVMDGACFPSGCWQNVTLTIMALAARSSEHLARELAAGSV